MILPITLSSAAACGLINFWLGVRVGQVRMGQKIYVGDGGNDLLVRRMRAHSNFTEYAPFVLILIAALELGVGSQEWLWAAAALFIVGRLLHPLGMDGGKMVMGRRIGIITTFLVLIGLSVLAAWLARSGSLPF